MRRPASGRARAAATARYEARLAAWERAQAFNHILDGSFGDPVAVARGEVGSCPGAARAARPAAAPSRSSRRCSPAPRWTSAHRALAQAILDEARELARRHRFTHWQLAFPNIWRDWSSGGAAGRLRRGDRQPALRPAGAARAHQARPRQGLPHLRRRGRPLRLLLRAGPAAAPARRAAVLRRHQQMAARRLRREAARAVRARRHGWRPWSTSAMPSASSRQRTCSPA